MSLTLWIPWKCLGDSQGSTVWRLLGKFSYYKRIKQYHLSLTWTGGKSQNTLYRLLENLHSAQQSLNTNWKEVTGMVADGSRIGLGEGVCALGVLSTFSQVWGHSISSSKSSEFCSGVYITVTVLFLILLLRWVKYHLKSWCALKTRIKIRKQFGKFFIVTQC